MGASAQLVQLGLLERFEWLMSVPLSFEYEDVLCRKEHLSASGFDESMIHSFVDMVLLHAVRIILDSPPDLHLPDPDDLHVHRLAIAGDADAVITHNVRHFASLPAQFGVKLYTPADLLRQMRGDLHE
jgi:predicted nucleic acid-binding protein